MANLNLSITDPMFDWIQQRVDSGQYSNVDDYFRDLISRDQLAENDTILSVDDIRRSIELGRLDSETFSADDVYAEIIQKIVEVGKSA